MKDQKKTKAQLIDELKEMRQRIAVLEQNGSKQNQTETALHESEAKFRSVVEGSIQGILVHQNTKPLFVNKAFAKILGYETPDEILAMASVVPLIALYDQGRLLSYHESRLKGVPAPEYYEYDALCKDGSTATLQQTVTMINWDNEPAVLSAVLDITEQVRAREALQESEKLLRQVIDTSPYSIFVKDRNGRYLLVNKKMAESHNTSPEDMVGTTDLSVAEKWLTSPEKIERFRASERDVTDRKKTQFTKEEKFIFQDGTERWFQTVKTPISLKDNHNCLMGIAVDITERVQAEQNLRESEAKFRNIVESSPMGMHMYQLESDDRLVFVDVNSAADKILGVDNSQFIGKTIEEAFPPLAETEVPERYRRAAEQGESWFTEQITYEDDNISGAFEVHAFQTEPGKMAAMFLDITDRKQAEAALRESEARYRTLFEHANDAIFLENENDEIIDANRRACEMMGYTREELLQMTVSELQAPEVRGKKGKVVRQELKKYGGDLFESLNLHRDGTRIPVEVSTASISGQDIGLVLSIVRNITERKKAEEALEESNERLLIILDSIEADVYVADMETYKILFMNRHMRASFGEGLVGEICWHVFRGGSEPCPHCTNDQLLDAEGDPTEAITWEGKNPITGKWYINYDRAIKWVDGRLVRLQVATDITERKRAEEALRENEAKMRSIFRASPTGIGLVTDRILLDVNEKICEMLGYSQEELIGKNARILYPTDEEYEHVGQEEYAQIQEQGTGTVETRWERKDSKIIDVLLSSTPLNLVDLSAGVIFTALDITERKRAEEEIQSYTHRIEALLEIERAITSTLDLEEVLEIIMTELARVIPYNSISLQSRRNESMEILACRGFTQPDEVVGLVFPLDPKYPNEAVVTKKAALAVEDVTQSYPHFQSQSTHYKSGHIRSWLGVPLVSKGEVTGMIALDRAQVIPFSKMETQLATAIASQAALAIENARLLEETQRRLERLTSLRHIDRTITSSLDLRVTLNILLGHILQQLEVDAAAVLLYQPELQSLEFVAGQGFRTQALQATNLRLGQGFAGQAALEGRILQISDLSQLQTGFLRSPDFRNEGFAAYVGVPLTAKGVITGVLEIYHRQPLDLDSEWMAFLETLAGQAAIAIDNIKLFNSLQMSNLELVYAYDATIEGWARALELRDMEPEGHSRRVVDLTLELARELGVEEKQQVHIRRGALLHDLGMMGISDAILQKPGALTDDEWQVIREHPVHAYQWLAPIEYLKPALDIPYCHHEKWNGSGYPQGLEGERIPLSARIFALVDVWDALRSDRPYRKAWSREQALSYLREQSGRHFDPRVLEAFLNLLAERGYLTEPH